jgi:hypothetical protein
MPSAFPSVSEGYDEGKLATSEWQMTLPEWCFMNHRQYRCPCRLWVISGRPGHTDSMHEAGAIADVSVPIGLLNPQLLPFSAQ